MSIQRVQLIFSIVSILAIGVGFARLGPTNAQADENKGYPERVAGYEVLSVRDSDNTSCYAKDVPLFVLKSTETSADNLMSSDDFDMAAIKQAIVDAGHSEKSEIIMAGPLSSKQKARQKQDEWNYLRNERGCIRFGGNPSAEEPDSISDVRLPGAVGHIHPVPGYSIVVDDEITYHSNHNAQSIELKAPAVGDNQDYCSAFVHNVYTTGSDLLQNGLLFEDGNGYMVWTDEEWALSPQYYGMDYDAGHWYYFTISYTNNLWWLCTKDRNVGSSSYVCRTSPETDGTRITGSDNTSVWVENQNDETNWYSGFTNPWMARRAQNYINGGYSHWTEEIQETTHCCNDTPDPTDVTGAIMGSLINAGAARFYLSRVPTDCTG